MQLWDDFSQNVAAAAAAAAGLSAAGPILLG